jgi:hypothetical protein
MWAGPAAAGKLPECMLSIFPWARYRKCRNIKIFHLDAGPWGFPEKCEAGFHRGIIFKTVDADFAGEYFPTEMINELHDNSLEGESVQGVVGLFIAHGEFSPFLLFVMEDDHK